MRLLKIFIPAAAVLLTTTATHADGPYQYEILNGDLSWANVTNQVFSQRCYFCHNRSEGRTRGNLGLDTYAEVRSKANRIYEMAIVLRRMPPSGAMPLTQDQYGLLKAWLEAGAPLENAESWWE